MEDGPEIRRALAMDPEIRRAWGETAYRRGVHQALASAREWLGGCRDIASARELLRRAEKAAHHIRYDRREEDVRLLLDEIRREIASTKGDR